jgi:hypothetical protein
MRVSDGARPSPGAEKFEDSAGSGFTGRGISSDIAAPGDGRAPGKVANDSGVSYGMKVFLGIFPASRALFCSYDQV